MATRCMILRGFAKEIEEEINKFLSSYPVRVLHVAQSEFQDHITVTLLFEHPDADDCGALADEVDRGQGRR